MEKTRSGITRMLSVLLLLLVSAYMLMPFFWIISTSLRHPHDSFRLPPSFFPTAFYIENYTQIFNSLPFFSFLTNSVIVAVTATVFQLLISSMAAYTFARLNFPGRNILFILILSGLMIPSQSTIIPVFVIIIRLGLVDNLASLILPRLISPLGIFLMRQFMLSIPKSYDESAMMDGAGKLRIYAKIILPMSVPPIMVVMVLSFIGTWNDFFAPLIFINTLDRMTLPLGMAMLRGYMGTGSISVVLAGVTVSLIVPLLLFVFGQKQLMQGVILTGVKS